MGAGLLLEHMVSACRDYRGAWPLILESSQVFQSIKAVMTNITQTGWLRNKHLFLMVLETEKSKFKADSVTDGARFLVHRGTFLL